eukprot:TRINITY_DN99_c0_g3_i3.p1 TRINITY_DN99_c0_g3~~TRINITY_DN99_c0_g3_i3.p1  ORF type:complete len:197 (-),score=48.57 TRINITY_DN99_c0_g3_i3:45-635(-)
MATQPINTIDQNNQFYLDSLFKILLNNTIVQSQSQSQSIDLLFNVDFCRLLIEQEEQEEQEKQEKENKQRIIELDNFSYYPSQPFYQEIIKRLIIWMKKGEFPIKFVDVELLNETISDCQRLQCLTSQIQNLYLNLKFDLNIINSNDILEIELRIMKQIIELISEIGIQTLLNIRHTFKTIPFSLPPTFLINLINL